ncbi:MAG: hypothetical protein ACT4QC_00295 [Planctomycetaceae bacterium]
MTLVFEWPFVAASMGKGAHWMRRSCVATLVVQSISYALLFAWYGMASGTTLYTRMSIVAPGDIALPEGVVAYYIGLDGDVYRRRLSTGQSDFVYHLGSTDVDDRLSVKRSAASQNAWELVALLDSGDANEPKRVPLGISVSSEDLAYDNDGRVKIPDRLDSPSAGRTSRVGAGRESSWTFEAGYWANAGLHGDNSKTGARVHFSLETPFLAWPVRHVTLLPADVVLFQLSRNQICVLEPTTAKIARIAFGHAPIVVMQGETDPSTDGGPPAGISDGGPFDKAVLKVAAEYMAWGRVDDEMRWAMCRSRPTPPATGSHPKKEYRAERRDRGPDCGAASGDD